MKWFGPSWGAPVCKPGKHTKTPAGATCLDCSGLILADDRGVVLPFVGDPTGEAVYHHACLMRSLGLDRFPRGYGANYQKPVMRVRWAGLTLDDPSSEGSAFRVRCPVCHDGVLRVGRKLPTYELDRSDYCSKCVQRFEYTDDQINGEDFAPLVDPSTIPR